MPPAKAPKEERAATAENASTHSHKGKWETGKKIPAQGAPPRPAAVNRYTEITRIGPDLMASGQINQICSDNSQPTPRLQQGIAEENQRSQHVK